MALTEGIVPSPCSLCRDKTAAPRGVGRHLERQAGGCRQGQESAGKVKKSLQAAKSALCWGLGAGVAAGTLRVSRGTGSSRSASAVPPELLYVLEDWAGWSHCCAWEWAGNTLSIPDDSLWWNILLHPLHLIFTLLAWHLIKQSYSCSAKRGMSHQGGFLCHHLQ